MRGNLAALALAALAAAAAPAAASVFPHHPAVPAAYTLVILPSESPRDGTVFDNASVDSGGVIVGDTVLNNQAEGFLSFDISMIPPGATINLAVLNLSAPPGSVTGTPFALGNLQVCRQDYNTLTSDDFRASVCASPLASLPGPGTVDVTSSLQSAVNQGKGRYQLRLQFPTATDSDGAADYVSYPDGGVTLRVNYTAPSPGFTLVLSKSSLTLSKGSSKTLTVTVSSIGSYSCNMYLSASWTPYTPSGIQATLSPPAFYLGPGDTKSATLTVTASQTAETGTYTLWVTAGCGLDVKTASVSVSVKETFDFWVWADPPAATVRQGDSTSFTIHVNSTGSPKRDVQLSVSGIPQGTTHSLNPASATPPYSATLTLSTSTSTSPGTYYVTVSGTDGTKTRNCVLTLNVEAVPDFSVYVTPTSVEASPGDLITFSVSVIPATALRWPLYYRISGLPEGSSYSSRVAGPYTTDFDVSVGGSPGNYTVWFVVSSDGITRWATARLTVSEAPSFSISVSPDRLEASPGGSARAVVSVSPSGGYSGAVSLTVAGAPNYVSWSLDPSSGEPPFSAELSLHVNRSATPGELNLSVVAVGEGGRVETGHLTLSVGAAPGFSFGVQVYPENLTLGAGESATVEIYVSTLSGEPSPVNIRVLGIPPSVSYQLSPSSLTPDGRAELTLSAGPQPQGGDYPVVVLVSSDGYSSAAQLSLRLLGGQAAPTPPPSPPSQPQVPLPLGTGEILMIGAIVVGVLLAVTGAMSYLRRRSAAAVPAAAAPGG